MNGSDDRGPRVAVLASGAGSTLAALLDAVDDGGLRAKISLLIASRPEAGAIVVARGRGIEARALDERALGREAVDEAMRALLDEQLIDVVVLAGYTRLVGPRTLAAYAGRIVNTHPAPLPRFGGRGMYGEHVHRAVLDAGVRESAATVHLVDAGYDTGAVIASEPVPVLAGDDVASLRARVQVAERRLLVAVLDGWGRSGATPERPPGSAIGATP